MKNSAFQTKLTGLFIVLLLVSSVSVCAQTTSYYFYVQFTDKNNSPYSLSRPGEFLSERAVARRSAYGLACDSTDLPVNPSYLQQLRNLGIPVHCWSKWMNGATVLLPDSSMMTQVRRLSFVKFVEYTGKLTGSVQVHKGKLPVKASNDYGIAAAQIAQLNGTQLHSEGYRGKGIQIGVIDAGFMNVNTNPAFDSLRLQGRLLGTKDIINPGSDIYAEDPHGAMVLSAMTGNLPGQYLGTAPDASFWLIRTEYVPTEYKVETDFWVAGIEFADSVGVDLATSSLGYYTFDDPLMNFTYADMNGKVSRASRAANMAGKKGILVTVAAGNEGNNSWHYIGTPADAEGIVTVGAVTANGTASDFSSFGPSSDGRVKPELCATGSSAALIGTGGITGYGSGTSFATPIMAGMLACLLQRYKALDKNLDLPVLLNVVLASGSLHTDPTAQLGYGIPDFVQAERNLKMVDSIRQANRDNYIIEYDSSLNAIHIRLIDFLPPSNTTVRIYSMNGSMLLSQPIVDSSTVLKTDKFPVGIYAVCISGNGGPETRKVMIK
ncbi:MAG: S8 family peptidase [Bacteroidota bacterium]|nr:S8 family peptidase [Bacteroidota bacterium]